MFIVFKLIGFERAASVRKIEVVVIWLHISKEGNRTWNLNSWSHKSRLILYMIEGAWMIHRMTWVWSLSTDWNHGPYWLSISLHRDNQITIVNRQRSKAPSLFSKLAKKHSSNIGLGYTYHWMKVLILDVLGSTGDVLDKISSVHAWMLVFFFFRSYKRRRRVVE